MQAIVQRHMGERVHVRADVSARDDDLARGGAAVGADAVAVTALQRHPEAGMVGGDRDRRFERLREVVHLHASVRAPPRGRSRPCPFQTLGQGDRLACLLRHRAIDEASVGQSHGPDIAEESVVERGR